MEGIKNIHIQVKSAYPVISAYEFEFLKEFDEVQQLWSESTIYFIVQRPLIYFNKLHIDKGIVKYEISDMNGNSPLTGSLDPYTAGFAREGESFHFTANFYKGSAKDKKSLDYVSSFAIETETREHLAWITPQKIIHLSIMGSEGYALKGNVKDYIDYRVHYIGQAFSQDIWSRLTGHEKMQSILTREALFDSTGNRNSFEIALILMEVTGFSEVQMMPFQSWMLQGNTKPIVHNLQGNSFNSFCSPFIDADDQSLTNEVEALLVNSFQPEYNKIKFKKYPDIANGTRSKGYTEATLQIEYNPVTFVTDSHKIEPVFVRK
ncbi:hypothetical protein [Vibrio cidicii]|uniref:hypothetical protein n=1 Tax=Vibrio cidicii TaxID=1763883 RepID=UPI0018C2CDB2|nr:hypothetical protein [Vibrio cidicii]MBG0757400.1 hypothetical protein [Vibrio cidicii]